jgi:hypothetical protein
VCAQQTKAGCCGNVPYLKHILAAVVVCLPLGGVDELVCLDVVQVCVVTRDTQPVKEKCGALRTSPHFASACREHEGTSCSRRRSF